MGGKFHLKLNTGGSPIAHKYREGKVQRTLKRELKELEIANREAVEASACPRSDHARGLFGLGLSRCLMASGGFGHGWVPGGTPAVGSPASFRSAAVWSKRGYWVRSGRAL